MDDETPGITAPTITQLLGAAQLWRSIFAIGFVSFFLHSYLQPACVWNNLTGALTTSGLISETNQAPDILHYIAQPSSILIVEFGFVRAISSVSHGPYSIAGRSHSRCNRTRQQGRLVR
jgi:hypothetical protein